MSVYRCKFILLFIFVFTIAFYSIASESKIDSLIVELQNKDLDALKEADLLKELANQYYIAGDYASALENASKALSIFTKIKQNKQRAETLKLIGDVYSNVNDFDKSVEHYLNSMAIAESSNNSELIALINSELGRLFIKISEFSKALDRFNLSNSFYEVSPDKYSLNLVTNYANIGVTYGSMNMLDSALLYFEKAFLLYPESDRINRAGVLNNIGAIKYKQGEYVEALDFYEDALDLFVEANHNSGIGIALFNLAQTYLTGIDAKKTEE